MKTKKLLLGVGFSLLGMFVYAQNGLEQITVERYYVTNAADSIQADKDIDAYNAANGTTIAHGALRVGAVTYRIYADMLPGYKLVQPYGDNTKNQFLKITTSTNFYNHPLGTPSPLPGTPKTSIQNNLLALDTYLSLGGVANGQYGILKAEDDGVANNITVAGNTGNVLLHNDPSIGIVLTTQDGMIAGTGIQSITAAGFTPENEAALNSGATIGNSFIINNGSWFSIAGSVGPDAATNKVLIGQFTTNGAFHFEINVVLKAPNGKGEYYVAKNPAPTPTKDERSIPSLIGDFSPIIANVAPTASITAPANGASYITGDAVAIAADAVDTDGTVASVEFFVDGTSVGVDNTAPFTASYTAAVGAHAITAKATDNQGLTGAASVAVNINVANPNDAPQTTITAPANGASYTTGDAVAITAVAADPDGTVASVEIFVDGVSVGVDNSSPYTANYTATVGPHAITAKATDNLGLVGSASATVNINVTNANVAPTATITAPANGATFTVGSVIAINANATDSDGSVASVEFFVDGTSVGVDNTAPFTANYTSVSGSHSITAKATDNQGLTGPASTPVTITEVTPNSPPTATITAPANGSNFNIGAAVAISVTATDSDGSVASVEFFVDGTSVGVDNTAPYAASYTAAAGSHAITAKATDNLGLTGALSAAVNINVIPSGIPYLTGNITDVCTNPSFCLPIIAADSVKDVIGYDLTVKYNPAKVHATGNVTINNALINPTYASYTVNNNAATGNINISIYLNGTAPANTFFHGVGQLICVEFTKDPSLLAVDTALFSVPTLQESYVTGVADKLAADGKYINKKNTAYDGSLKFWSDNSPIKYDIANPSQYLITNIYGTDASCANKSATAVQPDLLGKFSYNTLNGSSIQIERDILPTTLVLPVINGFDANLANKVLVNDLSFIPNIYQAIALDVNTDGVISAGDVSQINQRAADVIHEFKQKWNYSNLNTSNGQLSKDWLFLDSTLLASPAYKISTTYPTNDGTGYSKSKVPVVPFCLALPSSASPNCPVYNQTAYTGILLGDVDGNYDAIANDGKIKKASQAIDGTVYFNLDQATTGAGYIDIPVSFVSAENIVSLDVATQINENHLSYNNAIAKVDYLTDALGNYSGLNKTVVFTSNSIKQNLESDQNIMAIRFNTLTGVVKNSDLFNMSALLNGKAVKVELKGNIATGISTSDNNVSVAVYPNPATNVINVVFPERAVVELMDLAGRNVMISTIVNANQKQEISTENLANGMYLLKIYNDNFVSTQRIVIDNNK